MSSGYMFRDLMIQSTRRRLFVSYHHKDEAWRAEWERLFSGIFINHSVKAGEIDDSNSAAYIKRLIQLDYVSHASVMVVLVGKRTYCRKHVDWEISAALNRKLNGYSGLVGAFLPDHPDFGKTTYTTAIVPPRLADNIESGFSKAFDWTSDAVAVRRHIEDAFEARISRAERINNSRLQFAYNLCD